MAIAPLSFDNLFGPAFDRLEVHADTRQTLGRRHGSKEGGGPIHAPVLFEARTKIGYAKGLFITDRPIRIQDRRVDSIALMNDRMLDRFDQKLSGVGIKEIAEHRRTVGTWHAQPSEATLVIDERRDLAVSD